MNFDSFGGSGGILIVAIVVTVVSVTVVTSVPWNRPFKYVLCIDSRMEEKRAQDVLREQGYAECRVHLPKRYTSDPDVINSPEEMEKVKAEWALYFACMNAVTAKYPVIHSLKENSSSE
jgi:hypothetical protein